MDRATKTHDAVTVEDELHVIFRESVSSRFALAHRCLTFARIARLGGHTDAVAKWVRHVRALRTAAARWRNRARSVAPMIICLVWCFASGCVMRDYAVRVTDTVSLPEELVLDACEETNTRNEVATLEHAAVLYYDDAPFGLACELFVFGTDQRSERLVDFRTRSTAVNRIRAYLMSNGIDVPEQNAL
jgi:hypothetical protein